MQVTEKISYGHKVKAQTDLTHSKQKNSFLF